MKTIRQNWFTMGVCFIVAIAIILRFVNYNDRWGLAYDQARDTLLARYALEQHKFPLLGPFSSAGEFQTPGEWYWLLMLGVIIYPWSVMTPWIFLTALGVLFVTGMILISEKIGNKQFALIVGILAAVSPAGISQFLNLTNQTPVALASLATLWFALRYLRRQNSLDAFFLGFSISLGISFHLQAPPLLIVSVIVLLFSGWPSVSAIFTFMIGLVLPFSTLIFYDYQHNFINARGVMKYVFYDQYKVSYDQLGRRWLTYLFDFWPTEWGLMVGGSRLFGYFIFSLTPIVFVYDLLKNKLNKFWRLILISFVLMLVSLRYTHAPLFSGYLVFFHPFILLITGWIIYSIGQKKRILGLLVMVILVVGSLTKDIKQIILDKNFTNTIVNDWKKALIQTYPNSKFAIYDYHYVYRSLSASLELFLEANGKGSESGVKVGIIVASAGAQLRYPVILGAKGAYQLYDLSHSSTEQLDKEGWAPIRSRIIYKTTEEWR